MCGCLQLDSGLVPGSGSSSDAVVVLDRVGDLAIGPNDNTLRTLYTFTVPAGLVATDLQRLALELEGDMLQGLAGAPNFQLRISFAGLLWYQDNAAGRLNLPVSVPWRLKVEITRKSATTFYGSAEYDGGNANNGATTGGGDLGQVGTVSSPTLPLDSIGDRACDWSLAQTLLVQIQLGASDPNYSTTRRTGILERK